MERLIWISFDLGIRGDYEGMYAWLDDHGAKECGDGVACLRFDHDDSCSGSFEASLKAELQERVELDKRSRIYVVRKSGPKVKGRFLFGKRKGSPWYGFGSHDEQDEDDSEA